MDLFHQSLIIANLLYPRFPIIIQWRIKIRTCNYLVLIARIIFLTQE